MRIAVSGYYGCGNTGDEAVLAGIVESFEQRAGTGIAEFTVFSACPGDTIQRHGLAAVDRMNVLALRRTLKKSDLLISGGGSLLQDTTSLRSLIYYLWVVRLARSCGAPVIFYAQGIGPLRRKVSRALTRLVANRVQQITVRDEESADLLKRIGVNRPPIEVTADPAFALTAGNPSRAEEILKAARVPSEGPLIGLSVRPWNVGRPTAEHRTPNADRRTPNADDLIAVAQALSRHASVVLLPMQPPSDLALSVQIVSAIPGPGFVVRRPLSPRESLAVIGRLDGLVAMRLHALIFGAMAGVPLAAISYDPKVAQLMARLHLSDRSMPLADLKADSLAEWIAGGQRERETVRANLLARATEMKELALVNVDRALRIAGR